MAIKKPFTIKSLEVVLGAKADGKFKVEVGELMVRVVTEVVATEAVDLVVIIMPGAEPCTGLVDPHE